MGILDKIFSKNQETVKENQQEPLEILFISGLMRSGTTVLQSLVTKSLGVNMANEFTSLNVIVNSYSGLKQYNILSQLSEEDFKELYKNFFADMFERYATKLGTRKFVIKDPLAINNIYHMTLLMPYVKFAVSARDPRATYASIYRVRSKMHKEGVSDTFIANLSDEEMINFVSNNNAIVLNLSKAKINNLLVCQYEKLVTRDKEMERSLSSFLKVPLDYDIRHFGLGEAGKAFETPVAGKAISDSRISAFDDIPDELISAVMKGNEEFNKHFGYV